MKRSNPEYDVETKIRGTIEDVMGRARYLDGYKSVAENSPIRFVQVHFAPLAAYLTTRSLDRQEHILGEQRRILEAQETLLIEMQAESKAMRRHSRIMVQLTFAILIATLVNIAASLAAFLG